MRQLFTDWYTLALEKYFIKMFITCTWGKFDFSCGKKCISFIDYCNMGQKISKLRPFVKYLGKSFSMPGNS